MRSRPRIAIVGGGPAGLTMGVLLHKHHIPFTIFELRPKPSAEELAKPSGMLDLHDETGLFVIKQCDLYEKLKPLTGDCSEDYLLADKAGKIVHLHQSGGKRPEISRNNLAKLLMNEIPSNSIKWGHGLRFASRAATTDNAESEIVLDFGESGNHSFDLVIGADGAWSKVRKLLTEVKPHFTGAHIVTLTIEQITTKYPHLAKLVGSGSFTSLGNRHAIISQRGPYDSARIYLWISSPDEKFAHTMDLVGNSATSAKEKLLKEKLFGGFGTSVKELVMIACDEESANNPGLSLDIRSLHTLTHGSSWDHQPGVTLIGDAAHLMLPNGEGVNAAMLDSLLLSQAIVKGYEEAADDFGSFQQAFDPTLEDFETSMVGRAVGAGKDTDILIGRMLGTDDAAYEFVNLFKGMEQ